MPLQLFTILDIDLLLETLLKPRIESNLEAIEQDNCLELLTVSHLTSTSFSTSSTSASVPANASAAQHQNASKRSSQSSHASNSLRNSQASKESLSMHLLLNNAITAAAAKHKRHSNRIDNTIFKVISHWIEIDYDSALIKNSAEHEKIMDGQKRNEMEF